MAAATAAWLGLVAEFDEREGWAGSGIKSCGHWLAWQCGMSPTTARDHVRVARALRTLPRISAAFSAGKLSYAKVRALTRIAAADCEDPLLEFALAATASQTERFCRAWRKADDDTGKGGGWRPEDGQEFRSWTDEDGYINIKVRMLPDTGVPLITSVESLAEREARRERAQNKKAQADHDAVRGAGGQVDREVAERCDDDAAVGRARERMTQRRIAAMAALAEARAGMDRRAGDPPRREVVVHVDAAVLADDTAAGRAFYEGGPAITASQARRMLCEATAIFMLEQGHEPLAVGRKRRRATKAQRRALLRRDGGCARPGCPETRIERLHAHHMRHWLYGGKTNLNNLVLLCDVDHGLVHDEELVMSRKNGQLVVLTRDGVHVWGTADAAFLGGVAGLARPVDALAAAEPFTGVHPLDTTAGRRPSDAAPFTPAAPAAGRPARRRPGTRRRPGQGRPANRSTERRVTSRSARRHDPSRESTRVSSLLFPDGEPALPEHLQLHYEPMDLRWAINVLMGNREVAQRLAAEAQVTMTG
jgi:hypothetical protein